MSMHTAEDDGDLPRVVLDLSPPFGEIVAREPAVFQLTEGLLVEDTDETDAQTDGGGIRITRDGGIQGSDVAIRALTVSGPTPISLTERGDALVQVGPFDLDATSPTIDVEYTFDRPGEYTIELWTDFIVDGEPMGKSISVPVSVAPGAEVGIGICGVGSAPDETFVGIPQSFAFELWNDSDQDLAEPGEITLDIAREGITTDAVTVEYEPLEGTAQDWATLSLSDTGNTVSGTLPTPVELPAGGEAARRVRVTVETGEDYTLGVSLVGANDGTEYARATQAVAVETVELSVQGPAEAKTHAEEHYDLRLRNQGDRTVPELLRMEVVATRDGGQIASDEIDLTYDDDAGGEPIPLEQRSDGALAGTVSALDGFPLSGDALDTIGIGATLRIGETYEIGAEVTGVDSGETYVTASRTVEVDDEVEASATTVQFIPGKEENPSRGGHPLNSGLMQVFPEGGLGWVVEDVPVDAKAKPVYDSWLGGDMVDKHPGKLENVRDKKEGKYIDDAGPLEFKEYRIENGVSISFETTKDRGVNENTIEIQFNEIGRDGNDSIVARGNQQPPKTVLHDHEINGIPYEDWYGENIRPSERDSRYYAYDTEFEFNGIQGVRVLAIWGGYAAFMQDFSDRVSENAAETLGEIWDWDNLTEWAVELLLDSPKTVLDYFVDIATVVPRSYSFIDFIVLADGRRYVRVWDASQYPSLYTYVDGTRRYRDDMPYAPKQLWNLSMIVFQARASIGLTPFNGPLNRYFLFLNGEPYIRASLRQQIIDILDLVKELSPPEVDELIPTIPRLTLGYTGRNTVEEVKDADAPFPSEISYESVITDGDTLPPN